MKQDIAGGAALEDAYPIGEQGVSYDVLRKIVGDFRRNPQNGEFALSVFSADFSPSVLKGVEGFIVSEVKKALDQVLIGAELNELSERETHMVGAIIGETCKRVRLQMELEQQKAQTEYVLAESERDPMTGVYNKAFFNKYYPDIVDACWNNGLPLSVIFLDLDKLKHVNDHRGHDDGDAYINWFAEVLTRHVRKYDRVIRIGGDEFIIVCPGVNSREVCGLAFRLSVLVKQAENLPEPIKDFKPSVSMGVASLRPALYDDEMACADDFSAEKRVIKKAGEELVTEADSNLYIVKGKKPDSSGREIDRRGAVAFNGAILTGGNLMMVCDAYDHFEAYAKKSPLLQLGVNKVGEVFGAMRDKMLGKVAT